LCERDSGRREKKRDLSLPACARQARGMKALEKAVDVFKKLVKERVSFVRNP